MKKIICLLFFCTLLPIANAKAQASPSANKNASTNARIVSSGSNITEILFALGAGKQIVGADKTSSSPPQAKAIATLGHPSHLSIEGIISLRPTIFISDDKYLNPTLNYQLERAGTKVLIVKQASNMSELNTQIHEISYLLDLPQQGEALIKGLESDLEELSILKQTRSLPYMKAIFLYGKDSLLIAGQKTPIDFLLNMAGIVNPASFDGIKPMTPESIIIINPDVIITVDKALSGENGKERFFSIPAISATPAGINKRITTIPISHTNLGINTPKTAKKLFHEIYGTN
ncbi:ABC transporter substrate-binding protein [Vibrio sp. 99-70-13A1]|uniref:heme/hemin ABC transporter substrate-binding protein n=1 Tax=Vibrio sp. 99-70-13A1 TaxID=2607601 RepID=UPI001493D54B|nr:ABC transporter substrate-binding protein [Vibrio sp. 99-70-13A1]NOH97513.1 ABC transporter substrate-binding protein [Vibrio sp. 99-70-13A1]